MPFTPSEGAWQLAEHVSNLLASLTTPPPFTIYSYPSDNWPRRRRLEKFLTYLNIYALANWLYILPTPKSDEFHTLLARERVRAERNGNVFSLIIFKTVNLASDISMHRRMLVSLCCRLRDADEFGWYNDQWLGAILPYANHENAQRIAESVCQDLSLPVNEKTFTIYTYPENWLPDERSNHSHQ